MSAIQSNLASYLYPSYSSSTSSKHGASCNCASCAGSSSSNTSGGASPSNGAQSSAGSSNSGSTNTSPPVDAATPRDAQGKPLSQSQQNEVSELKKDDTAVRKHEQAHLSAAGGYARSGIVLNFKTGPDGKQYAVGGHVDIDTSVVKGDPAATVAKMETVQKAALAPADPSAQDVRVAAMAAQQASQARAQESQQQQAKASGGSASAGTAGASSGTQASTSAGNKASAGLRLSIAAKYSKSTPAAASSSYLAPTLDLVG